jgi:hypothetical protein
MAAIARASARIGRIRLPTRSDQYPAASREQAPAVAVSASSAPAAGAGQCRAVTRKTRANVATVNCGTTSSALAACSRHRAGARYGEAACPRPARAWCTGSRTTTTTSSTAARQNAPRNARPAERPCAASEGRVTAATATPSGWALCRMPIASPRCDAANQPRMSRPLAAYTEAPAAPAATRHPPSATVVWTPVAASSITPATASPLASTKRSPKRSAAAPQATRVSSRPTVGQATRTPACSRDSPCARSAGIR